MEDSITGITKSGWLRLGDTFINPQYIEKINIQDKSIKIFLSKNENYTINYKDNNDTKVMMEAIIKYLKIN